MVTKEKQMLSQLHLLCSAEDSGNMKNWFWSYNGFHSEACSLLSQRQSSPIFPDIILWKQTCLLLACHKRPRTTTSMYLVVIFGGKFRRDQVCLGWHGCRWEGRRKIQIGYGQSPTKWRRPLSKPTSPHDTSPCNPITSFWQATWPSKALNVAPWELQELCR